MFKVYNGNTRTKYEKSSKLTIKTPERCHWRHSGVFIINFEHISHFVLVFLLLTLNMLLAAWKAIFYEKLPIFIERLSSEILKSEN